MECPTCGFKNRSDARFCKQCGQSLPAPPGGICPACGATAKTGARFCPRCGKPLPAEPIPATPSPAQPPPLSVDTQPSMPSIHPPSPPPPAQPPAYTPLPSQPPPLTPPSPAKKRPSRWLLMVVGISTFLCIAIVLTAAGIKFGPDLLGSREEPTATPVPATEPPPTEVPATETPTPAPPTATPAPAFEAQVNITPSAAELLIGDPLTLTVTTANTGRVALSNLRYQLVGEPAPHLEWVSEEAKRHEQDVLPGETNVVTFTLRASQEGTASLQVYVLVDVHTDPPSTESLLSEIYTVSIASQ